jgi:hypothetical protein
MRWTREVACIREKIKIYKVMIVWHVDPLLGNDSEISKYVTAVAK